MDEEMVSAIRESMARTHAYSGQKRSKLIRNGVLRRVATGGAVETEVLEGFPEPWQRKQSALVCRAVAEQSLSRSEVRFVGAFAAFACGIGQNPTTGDLETVSRSNPAALQKRFEPLKWKDGYCIRSGVRSRTRALIPGECFVDAMGFSVLRRLENAVWCAGRIDAEVAFQISSEVVRDIAGFDRDDPVGSRRREHAVKAQMLALLEQNPRWAREPERARWIIANCDAGCESVGERSLVFFLRSIGVVGVITQQKIVTRHGTRYADISIDGSGVLGEYEGRDKDGVTEKEWWKARAERDRRDGDLAQLGIFVLHVSQESLKDRPQLFADLQAKAKRPIVIDPALGIPPKRHP